MKAVTPKQMMMIDDLAINTIGINGLVLMENAALAVVSQAYKMLGTIADKTIVVAAGKGNNGGDAFAVARHLNNKGAFVTIFFAGDKNKLKGDAKSNFLICQKMGIRFFELSNSIAYEDLNVFEHADLIIDGVLGTGINGEVKGEVRELINIINSTKCSVLSIDVPSGINAKTGELCGDAVKAQCTVTFALPKIGCIIHPGCEYTGELIVADISIPSSLTDSLDLSISLLDIEYVKKNLPARRENTNKGDYGKIAILTGSPGMTGAGCLAAKAAYTMGSGIVYLLVPEKLMSTYEYNLLESVTIPIKDVNGYFAEDSVHEIIKQLTSKNAILIGPGISTRASVQSLINDLAGKVNTPVVIDADALNLLSNNVDILKDYSKSTVITPHPGEMSRLTGISIKDIQKDRLNIALEFADKYNVIVVLKGSKTIVASPDGRSFINTSGNCGMAVAGMGDVLAGMITSLIGQGMDTLTASACAVHIHGLAGDESATNNGKRSLSASSILNAEIFRTL